jgi:hypothetical protein
MELFSCVLCSQGYSLADIKAGRYYPSTGVCLTCYQRLYRSDSCFGSSLHDPKAIACQNCPDKIVCSVFVAHRHDSMKGR